MYEPTGQSVVSTNQTPQYGIFNTVRRVSQISRQRRWQLEKHKNGLCIKCSKPAVIFCSGKRAGQTSVFCIEHLAEQRERNRARAANNGSIIRNKNVSDLKTSAKQTF